MSGYGALRHLTPDAIRTLADAGATAGRVDCITPAGAVAWGRLAGQGLDDEAVTEKLRAMGYVVRRDEPGPDELTLAEWLAYLAAPAVDSDQ